MVQLSQLNPMGAVWVDEPVVQAAALARVVISHPLFHFEQEWVPFQFEYVSEGPDKDWLETMHTRVILRPTIEPSWSLQLIKPGIGTQWNA